MDRAMLRSYIENGLSLEAIAERVGKHPSTVGYWVKKYGLVPAGRDQAAAKGALDRQELAELIEAGLPTREIAAVLERSQATVRHWMGRYGLKANARGRPADGICRVHGSTRHVLEGRGYFRCAKCRMERTARHRRNAKRILVQEAGGCCMACGYDAYLGALEFHHVDPATKSFHLSERGLTRSLDKLRAEAAKCVLLCSNCHAEVEGGFRLLSK